MTTKEKKQKTATERAIKDAVEGGYEPSFTRNNHPTIINARRFGKTTAVQMQVSHILLYPTF